MALIFPCHVIMIVVLCTMTSHATVSRTFKVMVNSTGGQVCAVDKPSTVIAMAASTMTGQCGMMCNVDQSCELFQFKGDLAQCELFDYSPSSFSAIDHCTAHAAYETPAPGVQSGNLMNTWTDGQYDVVSPNGIALLNGQMFVIRQYYFHVWVYETISITFRRKGWFDVPDLDNWLLGIAACATNNYVYVSGNKYGFVHRFDLSVTNTTSVMSWSVPGGPTGLSMTSVGNVLVTSYRNGIREYTPNGTLVRTIANSNPLWQAVPVNDDMWVFTVNGLVNGICTTLTNGTLIKCFNGTVAGSGVAVTQTYDFRSLAIDARGYFLAADFTNNRIIIVNPSLSEARQLLLLPLNIGLTNPFSLSFEESRGRLYIGEDKGQKRIMVFDLD